MEFAYEADTFDGGSFPNRPNDQQQSASGVSLKLSLSTADFTKKLQSLSLLGSSRNSQKDNLSTESASISSNAQALKRARTSIDLLNSLGFTYNPLSDIQNNEKSSIDNDDLTDFTLNSSNFDGKALLERLTKILESSNGYDSSLRHSLSVLEQRIAYEISLDKSNDADKSASESLKHLTSIGQQGNLARRNLRGLIEEDLLHQYASQLRNFQKIVKSIESVRPTMQTIIKEYEDLMQNLNKSIDASKDLTDEISSYNKQKTAIDLKKNLLLAFKSTFTVSQYEEHLVRFADLNDPTTGAEFFSTMEKIKTIQNNCDVLLGMENEKLGLSIIKQMSDLLLSVNERINSYVKNNIEHVYSGNSVLNQYKNINVATFQKCLIYLYQHNRQNFDSIMSDMVEARSRLIANEFISQLKGYTEEINTSITSSNLYTTPSSRNQQQKQRQPSQTQSTSHQQSKLFLSSYDTIKFISDTLAYIHGLLVNEMENARSFFTFDFISTDENKELEDMVGSVVISIISGLNNPLKGSIESILRQEIKLSTLVNSYELLELYSNMYTKLLNINNASLEKKESSKSNLITTMAYLENETQERVFFLINLKFKNLQAEVLDEDLNAFDDDVVPDWIVEWCAFIDELFEPYSSNKNLDDNEIHIIGLDDDKWELLLTLLVNKPIAIIDSFKKKSKSNKKEKIVCSLNCIDYFFSRININPLLTKKANDLKDIIVQNTNELIELEFTGLLKSSGLFDVFNLINMIFKLDDEFFDVAFYQPILENKLFNIDTFQTANKKLEQFFSSYINQNELNGLMSPTLYNKVFFDSSMKFISFYKKLCLIVNEYLRDSDGNKIKVFQWDEMSLATLLGIEEYYQEHQ